MYPAHRAVIYSVGSGLCLRLSGGGPAAAFVKKAYSWMCAVSETTKMNTNTAIPTHHTPPTLIFIYFKRQEFYS
jgi:hypothetical protein